MIPNIIHFIWWQGYNKIPKKFITNINSWKQHNLNYKLIIWDKNLILKFIEKFCKNEIYIINSYNKMIQKIDYSKYLIIYYYGGCYVDIDMFCNGSLNNYLIQDKLNVSKFYFTKIKLISLINNGFIACNKKNNNILNVIRECKKYANKNYLINELTVMNTTGPILFNSMLSNSQDVHIFNENIIYETNIQEYGINNKKGKLAIHLHEFSWINKNLLFLIKIHIFFDKNIHKIFFLIILIVFIFHIFYSSV